MGNSENGKNLCGVIAGYIVIKQLLNLILGFGFMNIIWLLVAAALGYCLITSKKYMNIATAVFLAVMVLVHIKDNISGGQVLYLIEAVIDVVCAAALVINKDIKQYFEHE